MASETISLSLARMIAICSSRRKNHVALRDANACASSLPFSLGALIMTAHHYICAVSTLQLLTLLDHTGDLSTIGLPTYSVGTSKQSPVLPLSHAVSSPKYILHKPENALCGCDRWSRHNQTIYLIGACCPCSLRNTIKGGCGTKPNDA